MDANNVHRKTEKLQNVNLFPLMASSVNNQKVLERAFIRANLTKHLCIVLRRFRVKYLGKLFLLQMLETIDLLQLSCEIRI